MSEELNCSDGAKMLIERMKTNPEEFRGGHARWAIVINQVLQVRRGGVENNIMMSKRDMNALWDAFERHVMEPALAEFAIEELMTPKPERKKVQVNPLTKAQLDRQMSDMLQAEFSRAYAEGNHAKAKAIAEEYEYRVKILGNRATSLWGSF
jgi:hypothetical protein